METFTPDYSSRLINEPVLIRLLYYPLSHSDILACRLHLFKLNFNIFKNVVFKSPTFVKRLR